jgi:hypothetical protein
MSKEVPDSATTESLLRLMEADEAAPERAWRPEDRAAMLRHEFSTPLRQAAERLPRGEVSEALVRRLQSPELQSLTLGELIAQPAPAAELLDLVKRVARTAKSHADPAVQDMATVLYYASVLTARVKCAMPISRLSDAELATGARWVLGQPWVEEPLRPMIQAALAALPK